MSAPRPRSGRLTPAADCYVMGTPRAAGSWCWTWAERPVLGLPLVLRGPPPAQGDAVPAAVLGALAEHLPGEVCRLARLSWDVRAGGVWAVWVRVPALAG